MRLIGVVESGCRVNVEAAQTGLLVNRLAVPGPRGLSLTLDVSRDSPEARTSRIRLAGQHADTEAHQHQPRDSIEEAPQARAVEGLTSA